MSIHLTLLIKKLDHLSDAEFHNYWSQEHPKTFLSVKIVQEKVVKYSQFHIDPAVTKALKDQGLPVSDFDGGVNFWGNSVQELMTVFQDEEYLRVVVPDEEKVLKRHEAVMMVGYDEDKYVDGKIASSVKI